MKRIIIISSFIFATILFTGCTQKLNNSVNIDSPSNMAADNTESTVVSPNSSGNVDKDLEEIEAAIDSLDIEADFPVFDSNDI